MPSLTSFNNFSPNAGGMIASHPKASDLMYNENQSPTEKYRQSLDKKTTNFSKLNSKLEKIDSLGSKH